MNTNSTIWKRLAQLSLLLCIGFVGTACSDDDDDDNEDVSFDEIVNGLVGDAFEGLAFTGLFGKASSEFPSVVKEVEESTYYGYESDTDTSTEYYTCSLNKFGLLATEKVGGSAGSYYYAINYGYSSVTKAEAVSEAAVATEASDVKVPLARKNKKLGIFRHRR